MVEPVGVSWSKLVGSDSVFRSWIQMVIFYIHHPSKWALARNLRKQVKSQASALHGYLTSNEMVVLARPTLFLVGYMVRDLISVLSLPQILWWLCKGSMKKTAAECQGANCESEPIQLTWKLIMSLSVSAWRTLVSSFSVDNKLEIFSFQ